MVSTNELPLGIRLNNPGNLRGYPNMDYNDGYEKGYAKFRCIEDGLVSMLSLMWDFYFHLHLMTPDGFVGRWAPASENDTARYVLNMLTFMGVNPLRHASYDLGLRDPWKAMQMAYAIIRIEQGNAPSGYPRGSVWIEPSLMCLAMAKTRKWSNA